ncbi:MAG TPA: penicillin-binding protein 2 [Chthonomonadaceae bacterium]|nr:penicillin-binding protein 2 [Chthonomonadaceae bacterium]
MITDKDKPGLGSPTIGLPDHIPNLRRLKCFYAAILVLLAVIIARLWYLQIVKGPELAGLAATLRTRLIRRVPPRGEIRDAKGRVLATNRSHFVVSVLPDEMKKNPQLLPRLALLLHKTEDELADEIRLNKTTPFDPVPVATDVDIKLLSEVEEQRLDLPGVLITKDPIRYYTDNRLCTHVLGIVRPINAEELETLRKKGYRGGDLIGKEGLEYTYEAELRGKEGGQRIEVDARGRMRRVVEEVKPLPGRTLRLTLDRDLQQVAYDALQEAFAKGHPGAAVALDPRDGAVLAFVSVPSYDLNKYGTDYNKLLKDPSHPLINRVSGSKYPCGSTFKLITAAAGLETGAITPTSRDYCPGVIYLGNRAFHCDRRTGHGALGFYDAIGESCDVYFWHVGMRVGAENLAAWARRFGVGSKTGIDLPVDTPGRVPTDRWKRKYGYGPWRPGDTLNMAIGQGFVGVSPLQLAVYTAALANGGTRLRPQLVREIIDYSSGKPVVVHRLKRQVRGTLGLSKAYRDAIVEGMRRALEPGGTAGRCAIPGLSIAGKTGTAEAVIHGKDVSHSVFVCFAPVENPKIAIAVLVEGGGFGADTAAPIARRILGRYFGIKLDNAAVPIGGHSPGVD